MSLGKRKGGGFSRGRAGSMGKPPIPKASKVSAGTAETARRATMRARVMQLARRGELEAGKSRPAPGTPPPAIPRSLQGNPAAQQQHSMATREAARAADWERRYQLKLKQVQGKDKAKQIARAKAIRKKTGR